MSRDLVIATSNPRPRREPFYPAVWLIHTMAKDPIEVYLVLDGGSKPRVLPGLLSAIAR